MANTITGIILFIGQTVDVPTNNQNGQPFYKRELVLDASRYDQFSGRKFENYPKFEFVGNNCAILDQFQAGQAVTVSFVLSGRKVEKDGQVSYFTNVTGYKVELYQRPGQQPQMAQQPQQAAPYQGQQPYPQPQAAYQPQQAQPANPFPATAPTGATQQPFPPAVDENGNPIGDPDDLPF